MTSNDKQPSSQNLLPRRQFLKSVIVGLFSFVSVAIGLTKASPAEAWDECAYTTYCGYASGSFCASNHVLYHVDVFYYCDIKTGAVCNTTTVYTNIGCC